MRQRGAGAQFEHLTDQVMCTPGACGSIVVFVRMCLCLLNEFLDGAGLYVGIDDNDVGDNGHQRDGSQIRIEPIGKLRQDRLCDRMVSAARKQRIAVRSRFGCHIRTEGG
ncbi:hypothetical protein D3C72_1939730 [compost metagenome]